MSEEQAAFEIFLEHSRHSRAFAPKESFWREEISQMWRLIRSHREALNPKRDNGLWNHGGDWERRGPFLPIAIFGSYGSGKSSLLHTFCQSIKYPDLYFDGEDVPVRSVRSLPILEPNIFARDESFLYGFLAAALEDDRQRRRHQGQEGTEILSLVQQRFESVSEYLQVLDQATHPVEYDPLGFSLDRLDRHTSGLRLRERMGDLIGAMTGEDGIMVFPVDNVDWTLENLISSLEIYRRYLLHPRLVPIFTFTTQLAEELLRSHFVEKVNIRRGPSPARLGVKSGALELADQLAFQYLGKLFPIRNRIQLGPAPARAQLAEFRVADGTGPAKADPKKPTARALEDVLKPASRLLFGWSKEPLEPPVRLLLRPANLRRQLQTVDAMVEAEVRQLTEGKATGKHWFEVFERAATAVLLIHWDVLWELRIRPEEVAGWKSRTPKSRQRAILGAVLALDLETRRNLIKRWVHHVEDRRGQALSLLAAKHFRPMMEGEEPPGGAPEVIRKQWESYRRHKDKALREYGYGQWLIWFLSLWLGFYLPQIMARNRPSVIPRKRRRRSTRVSASGWNLKSGPTIAALEMRRNAKAGGQIDTSGMMALNPARFARAMAAADQKKKGTRKVTAQRTLLYVWCSYGSDTQGPWATLSLWRGLALMGHLVEEHQKMTLLGKEECQRRLERVISDHCRRAWVPRATTIGGQENMASPSEAMPEGAPQRVYFPMWHRGRYEDDLKRLAKLSADWLDNAKEYCLDVRLASDDSRRSFQSCFVRRLNGDVLIGRFWRRLEATYYEAEPSENPGEGFHKWWASLTEFVGNSKPPRGGSKKSAAAGASMEAFLEDCPLVSLLREFAVLEELAK